MSRPFEVRLPVEQSYVRNALFGIELLDAVTLERVYRGIKVVGEGLHARPVVNSGGVFSWFREDLTNLRRVTIDPGVLPYEPVELDPSELQMPLTTIQLAPRADYPFTAGITGLHGVLIESRLTQPLPVRDAVIRLRWLDENGQFLDAPTTARTAARGGDFTAVLRLAPSDVPQLDAAGNVTVRLRALRPAGERESADLKLQEGRVADPSIFAQGPDALIFAWDELQPLP